MFVFRCTCYLFFCVSTNGISCIQGTSTRTYSCVSGIRQPGLPAYCVKDFSWFPLSQHQQHYMNSLDDRKSSSRNLIPCFVYWISRVRILEATSTILTTETSKYPSISNIETVYVRQIVGNRRRHCVGVSAVSVSTHMYLFFCCTLLKASTCK